MENRNTEKIVLDVNTVCRLLSDTSSLSDSPFEKKAPPQKALASLHKKEDEDRYFSSVPLHLDLKAPSSALLSVEGVADGIFVSEDGVTLDEIFTLKRKGGFEEAKAKNFCLARTKFLSYALVLAKKLSFITVRFCLFAEGEWEFQEVVFTKEELCAFLKEEADRLFRLAPLFEERKSTVAFPYKALRRGQRDLISAVWRAVKGKSALVASAPTGIGKTLAVLYPALKALEAKKADQVVYLSPKSTLKKQAAEAVEALQKEKKFRTLVLQAKMQLCPYALEECNPACPCGEGFYGRVGEALSELSKFHRIDSAVLTKVCAEFSVCPFETALAMLPYADVVIGDYNYVFDPNLSLPIRSTENKILLVDEAHNLPSRLCESYSETLSPEDFDPLFSSPSPASKLLCGRLEDITGIFAKNRARFREEKSYYAFSKPEALLAEAKKLLPTFALALSGNMGEFDENERRNLRALFKKIKKFVSLGLLFDSDFASLRRPDGGETIRLLIPREKIEAVKKKWRASVFFSATLLPKDYYFSLLGGSERDDFLELDSPFPEENLFLGVCDVDVSYSKRAANAEVLCNIIHTAWSVKKGNTMVFFPSFEMLGATLSVYKRRFFDGELLSQSPDMTYADRRKFIAAFQEKKGILAFCVLGGVFSEGIDLAGEALEGAIIVGTGFPPPSAAAEAESTLYFERGENGKDLAYTLPGFNRVLQACGRVIRSENDRGFLILCDRRYMDESFRTLFPKGWQEAIYLESEGVLRLKLQDFWK